jgi:hypothetical protein
MIAYTAVYGQYDDLKPHPESPLIDKWIAYTDDPDLKSDDWVVRHRLLPFTHPRVAAKWWKCHPPQGKASVWLDGSVEVHNAEYFDVLAEGLVQAPITMFEHPDRSCIYTEADVSRTMTKYIGQPLEAQVALYHSRGWPANGGLWASTTFARRHTPTVLQFGAAWFAHNDLLTYQDQLSLPVLLDQYGLKPAPIPGNLWRNDWFHVASHASDL